MESTGADHRFGACCTRNNFLGSSRTYVYLAGSIDQNTGVDSIKVGTPDRVDFDKGNRDRLQCLGIADYSYGFDYIDWKEIGDNSYLNSIILTPELLSGDALRFIESSNLITGEAGGLAFQDRIELKFEQGHVSEYMSHKEGFGVESPGSPLAWQDNGRINGILSPLFVAGWINCFGQPCYDCSWRKTVSCGFMPEDMMNFLSKQIDIYYKSQGYRPYDRFFEDWHGIISRNSGNSEAEPVTGWYIYVFFGYGIACGVCGYYDEYCGCCWFCFQKDCIEPFFIRKITGASILTLNRKRGIPFLSAEKLQQYYDSQAAPDYDIYLDDAADEIIFYVGSASWKHGDIKDAKLLAPWTGVFEESAVFNKRRGATIRDPNVSISGAGSGFNILVYNKGYEVQMSRRGNGLLVRDTFVANKIENNELSGSLFFDRGWIYVDVPPLALRELSYVAHTADDGNLPDLAYGGGVPGNPVAAFPFLTKRHKNLFVRTIKNNGNFVSFSNGYGQQEAQEGYFFSSYSDPGISTVTIDDKTTLIGYYKQFIKKIVKAPYNYYIKSGTAQFIECKLGESLKDLKPGRYYFPNPAIANRQLAVFDPDFEDLLEKNKVINEEFANNFNVLYRKFDIGTGANTFNNINYFKAFASIEKSLSEKYRNAKDFLGSPYSSGNSIRMEFGGEFDNTNFDFDEALSKIQNNDLAFNEAIEDYLNIQI